MDKLNSCSKPPIRYWIVKFSVIIKQQDLFWCDPPHFCSKVPTAPVRHLRARCQRWPQLQHLLAPLWESAARGRRVGLGWLGDAEALGNPQVFL